MKAEDLRLNNWVEIKDQDVKTYAQVEGIGNLQHVAGQLWSIEELEPIPLTEEWLTRLGFKKIKDSVWRNDFLMLVEQSEGGFFEVVFGRVGYLEGDFFILNPTSNGNVFHNYVHTLQNLYFALTGEELTIKEPA